MRRKPIQIAVNKCPFCGYEDVEIDEIDIHIFAVVCPDCEAMGPPSHISVEAAIEKWNGGDL